MEVAYSELIRLDFISLRVHMIGHETISPTHASPCKSEVLM